MIHPLKCKYLLVLELLHKSKQYLVLNCWLGEKEATYLKILSLFFNYSLNISHQKINQKLNLKVNYSPRKQQFNKKKSQQET